MDPLSNSERRRRQSMLAAGVVLSLALLGVAAAVLFVLFFRGLEQTPSTNANDEFSRPPERDQGFVGSQACAECHAEIAERYQSHPMAHSLNSVANATPLEDYEHADFRPPGPRRYRAEQTSQGVFHHESMLDSDDQPIYDQAVPIAYALGSGQRGRSYLIDRDGLLFQSSIGWYANGNRWDLSPSYDPAGHSRFERRIGDGCLYCHAGRVSTREAGSDRYEQPAFLEASIGCERCHGPGEKHIASQRRQATPSGRDDTIVNPAKLDHQRRESVCYQCHLQGEKVIARYGRTFFDFRPGDRLEDIWVIFVAGDRMDESGATRAVSQVEQMRSSKCYLQSNEKMGCVSCHDPHGKPAAAQRESFYTAKCNACHADRGCSLPVAERTAAPAAGSCIACHMPPVSAKDVPHTAQTDHRVLRRARSAEPSPDTAQTERFAVFDDADLRLPRRELDRARAIAIASRPGMLRHAKLAAEVQSLLIPPQAVQEDPFRTLDYLGDDAPALISLGTSYWAGNRRENAFRAWNRALQADPENEIALTNLALHLHDEGDLEAARAYLQQFVKINPNLVELIGRLTHVSGQLGETEAGIQWAKRGIAIDPSLPQLREWLVEAYEKAGEKELAAQQKDIANRLREALKQR